MIRILLVEDNPGDVVLANEALSDAKVSCRVDSVRDGDYAMAYLRRQAPFADSPRPDLVILDLNMPRKSGREVLAEMAADPSLNTIPVAVLTTSQVERDVCVGRTNEHIRYFVKPHLFDELVAIMREIAAFWKRASDS